VSTVLIGCYMITCWTFKDNNLETRDSLGDFS